MIRLTNVTKHFGATPIFREVSFSVAMGETCAIIGPSGGGKSTLLRTINGLESFDGGTIEIDGILLRPELGVARDAALREIRRRVGMVFQQFHLFPHLTAIENVMEAPIRVLKRPRAQARSDALTLLERVGLASHCDARPGRLSGGQQQRVAIARALAMEPKVILFDEPTSALDPQRAAEFLEVMQELASAGQTMLMVTHNIDLASKAAQRTLVLERGRLSVAR